ncbi:hypothetical protein LK12_00185 [Novosphingobium malaysiense]|uniref:Uncharacterized protein n=2 Tax=Novosphingobium malaysiense TaxID=1348853 RepID=A0A0B1ZNZ8_9SPHN|nr:hypothetical protein LK12_00185 [Novosphingobium malaysiense]
MEEAMPNSHDRSRGMNETLHELFLDNQGNLTFSDFRDISDAMMSGYARFIRLGVPGHTIGLAMLGATMNLYELFGMRTDLPELLRSIAARIEEQGNPN